MKQGSMLDKPISLWGVLFIEVLGSLLKTKPMPKANPRKSATKKP
jgi:hypothetical protein